MTVEFLLTTLIVVITPGTGVIYTIATGLRRGMAASMVAAIGCTLGIVPHMVAAITGLAALLHTSPLAFQILKFLGVAYLLYMAWGTLQEKGSLSVDEDPASQQSPMQMIIHGILINILNPKLTIFFFAFLPQFVDTTAPNAIERMIVLSAIFMLATLLVFIGYGKFASVIRTKVISRPEVLGWMRRAFGIAFIGLAVRLAFEE